MIYINVFLFLLYIVVTIASIVRVLMDNRQPERTSAWVLLLLFLPVVGFVLYFFFGQNTRKERLISGHSLDLLTKRGMLEFAEQRDLNVPQEHEALVRLFSQQNWALPFKNNTVDIFTNGYDYFCALLRDISRAKHHIHIDTYIFEDDPLGRIVADCLIDKARQGVKVRLIYDDVGCWHVKNRFFERMRQGGVEVYAFMPVRFPAFTSKVNYRNHRKLSVFDGKAGYIGGMNIALRYVRGNKGLGSWRDTHLRVEGNAVFGLQQAFLVDWYFVSSTLITDHAYYPNLQWKKPKNDCIMQVVTSSPISPWPDIMQGYVRILLSAKRYVYMETPYFLPTEPILFALRIAALAGVDVRLMVPMHSDAKLVEWASRTYVAETLASGVKVLLYKGGFNHSKLLVSDDSLSSVGSTNIDFRSFENNFEANAFIYDVQTAVRVRQIFESDSAHCVRLDDEMHAIRIPFLQRLWESLVRLLSPLL